MPMPPTQCVMARQNSNGGASTAGSSRIDAPVVVKPESTSKHASTTLGIAPVMTNGIEPSPVNTSQLAVTVAKASPKPNWSCENSNDSCRAMPRPRLTTDDTMNAFAVGVPRPSCARHSSSGDASSSDSTVQSRPST